MTIAIVNPQKECSLDSLRTLIVNLGLAVKDIFLVENNVDKNRLIKSGAIFIDEAYIEKIKEDFDRKFIFNYIDDSLINIDYVKLEKGEINGIFKTKNNQFQLITRQDEKGEFDAPIGTEMTCQIKLTLNRKKRFYGPGTAQLLKLIERTQSVKSAAIAMNISYSKALQMIRTIEKGLGFKVVEKKQGGTGGGESYLTYEGKQFVKKYEQFNDEVGECVRQIYKKYWQ